MLSFAAEFPISHAVEERAFLDTALGWIAESPHSAFRDHELVVPSELGDYEFRSGDEKIDIVNARSEHDDLFGFRHVNNNESIVWTTTAVFSRSKISSWVGIRTYRESDHPAVHLPPAKKPIIVKSILSALGGGIDGSVSVGSVPIYVDGNQLELASQLLMGEAGCHLPVVYISCTFDGRYMIDSNALANDLSGMAHVVVEPSREFSRRLQANVDSENVYGGVVGVYWPQGTGRRSFFLPRDFENASAMKRAIIEEIRSALLNRRPLHRCSWAAIREANSQGMLASLKASGSNKVEDYVKAFDQELEAKTQKLNDAEKEIARLNFELRNSESRGSKSAAVNLKIVDEIDLYPGEISSVILDALYSASSNVQDGSRRQHVLSGIIRVNDIPDQARESRTKLKNLLRDYKSMDKTTRRGLEGLGFSISEEGKHYKLVYHGDDRYTFALAKTGSDHRGGLNSASDIGKRIF